jgi:hypothetical protein
VSQRSCNHLTGEGLCSAVCHTSIKVPVAGQPPVWVNLCFAHRLADDNLLETLARAKIDRREAPEQITGSFVRVGVLVANLESKTLARITHVEDGNVRLILSNGTRLGLSKNQLKRDYGLPVTPKHPTT